jgi:hypothetical protein
MNTATRKPGLGHRIGRTIRRGWDKLNQFELRVARRAGRAFPAFGFWATRILFLVLKLAVFVVLAFIAVQLLFLALVFALLNRPQRVEVTNWDEERADDCSYHYAPDYNDIFDMRHQGYWPDHPAYNNHDDART